MTTQAVAAPMPAFQKTTRRVITRRGVLWLGQTCNIRCHFCYFLDRIKSRQHPEHAFMSLDKARSICSTLVDEYGNNAIDIQGGEPTIYKHIHELVEHCRHIGLLPTLITNAQILARKPACHRLKDAGVRDLLVSVQGLGETYDQIVGVRGAYDKQAKALDNLLAVDIPVRFNCVLSKPALRQLNDIARLAVDVGARVVNFLAFNPFDDQQEPGKRNTTNVPRYREVSAYLNEAMDTLAAADIECNVRYFPLCMVAPRHRSSMYNFQQLPYDIHEWDYASWSWTGLQPQRMNDGEPSPLMNLAQETYQPVRYRGPTRHLASLVRRYVNQHPQFFPAAQTVHRAISRLAHPRTNHPNPKPKDQLYRDNARMRAAGHERYAHGEACRNCAARPICDGFHGDYATLFGVDEASAITDVPRITDPRHFIAGQRKVVELEDYDWAL